MTEKEYCLAFSLMPGIGPKKFELILRNFKTPENAWKVDREKLKNVLGENLTDKFEIFRNDFDINLKINLLKNKNIEYVCLLDKDYPKLLKKIPNPPIVLFLKGNRKLLSDLEAEKSIAIVGTRRVTSYGRNITEMFASELASSGLIIISGLALGVDGIAHQSCLNSGGKTIAVLGSGVDICFPSENQKIYDEILKNNGLIISEMFVGETPSVSSFPSRNRIVAGLSDGVLVTEGAEDSGSLITANFGLDFGRYVFAVPGPITSSLSAAPLKLIEKGAKLVVSSKDILKELKVKGVKLKVNERKFEHLTKEERKIIELIENESLHFDEIIHRLKIDSTELAITLSLMEIKGLIKNSGGNYIIT